jgi:hypothetical protein
VPLTAELRGRMLDLIGWCVPHHPDVLRINRDVLPQVGASLWTRRKSRSIAVKCSVVRPAELADYEERLLGCSGEESHPRSSSSPRPPSWASSPTGGSDPRTRLPAGGNHENDLRVVLDVLLRWIPPRRPRKAASSASCRSDQGLVAQAPPGWKHVPAVERLQWRQEHDLALHRAQPRPAVPRGSLVFIRRRIELETLLTIARENTGP